MSEKAEVLPPAGQAYYIASWETLQETSETRKIRRLSYYAKSNKLMGEGIGQTLAQEDNLALLGAWTLIESLASHSERGQRGWLVRNGTALTPERMSTMFFGRVPADRFARALGFFHDEKVAWLMLRPLADLPPSDCTNAAAPPGKPSGKSTPPAAPPGDSPDNAPVSGKRREDFAKTDRGKTDMTKIEEEEEEAPFPEIPDDRMVFQYADGWPGEPASGAPKIPRAFAEEWVARMTGRREWPRDWKRKLVADWRASFRGWRAGAGKKNGPRERWQLEKDLAAMVERIKGHAFAAWPANKKMPPAVKKEHESLLAQRAKLETELKGAQ
jgi:hypothetical protein